MTVAVFYIDGRKKLWPLGCLDGHCFAFGVLVESILFTIYSSNGKCLIYHLQFMLVLFYLVLVIQIFHFLKNGNFQCLTRSQYLPPTWNDLAYKPLTIYSRFIILLIYAIIFINLSLRLLFGVSVFEEAAVNSIPSSFWSASIANSTWHV